MAPAAWPLVGRDEELELARGAVSRGSAGLVVTGAAGVGKTRIADELLTELAVRGRQVTRLLATRAAATIPFGAAASLLADRPEDPPPDPALPPHEAATKPSRPRQGGPTDLASEIAAARDALRTRAADGPLVVGVDDAHLLDDASAQLIYHLARSGDATLVMTARSAETAPSFVDALWEEGICQRLELQPLSRDEMAQLLAAALEGQVELLSVDTLWRVTAGNVLFLRELCRDALARGLLTQQHGVWTWTGEAVLSARLQELLDMRVGQLDGTEREAAALLALGEPLPRSVLTTLVPADAIEALERRGLLEGDEVLHLAHPLYAESLRGQLGPLETSDLYARLADGYEPPTDVTIPDDRMRIAVWSVSSGRPATPGLLAETAAEALQRGDAVLSERLARAAAHDPVARLVLGEALATLRRGDDAEEVLAPLAAEPAPPPPDDEDAGATSWSTRVAVARLLALRHTNRPLDDARQIAATAKRQAGTAEHDVIDAALADTLGYRGRGPEAGELGVKLLGSPDPAARALATGPAVAWLLRSGRAEDAIAAGRQSLAESRSSDALVDTLGGALLAAGRLDELDELLRTPTITPALDQLTRNHGTRAFLTGYAALLRGRPASAREPLREAVLGFQRSGMTGHQAFALALLAEAEALLGDAEKATQIWEALPVELRQELPVDLRRSGVWVTYVQQGDAAAAAREAIRGADFAHDMGASFFELILAYTAVELGAAGQAERVVTSAAIMQGPLVAALGAHAEGLLRRDGPGIETAAAELDRLGLKLFAAEAYVHAAQALRRADASTRATSAWRQATALRMECEGARTPLLTQGAAAADLTPREHEVALLAARGLTSREISDRLGVSIRTVDNQLGRVYTKLGISGRQELAAVIEQM